MKLSIVIPCRNEADYIANCLQSIVNTDFDKNNLEVWVCDGESTDNTVEIITSFASKYEYIKYLINTRKTTPFALNLGIKQSLNADFIMILGAHSELSVNYLKNCIETFAKYPESACIGGKINNVYENKIAQYIGKAMSTNFGVGNAHFRIGIKSGWVDTVAFGMYKSEVFKSIGFFDEDLARNQDDEFSYRMIKNGYKIYLNSNSEINYFVRSSYQKLFKQYFQYGLWKVFVNRKHHTITTIRQIIPFFLVSYSLITLISLFFSFKLFFVFSSLLILYCLLAVIITAKNSSNIREFIGILFSYFLLHYGYGLGYLTGIVKFIIFKKNPTKQDEILTR